MYRDGDEVIKVPRVFLSLGDHPGYGGKRPIYYRGQDEQSARVVGWTADADGAEIIAEALELYNDAKNQEREP